MYFLKKLKNIGPAAMVTAAFIGPGTIATASRAGADFGYALLWALLFSVIATISLQLMAARLGLVTQEGLGESLRHQFQNPVLRTIALVLVFSAIVIGNAAYEAGNISGAIMGMQEFAGIWFVKSDSTFLVYAGLIGVISFVVLSIGSFRLIQNSLITLVLLMSFVFLTTCVLAWPSVRSILYGLFIPTLPDNSIFLTLGLIGTTVVPYNLFLHASSVKEKWTAVTDMQAVKWDTVLSVSVGGAISMAIVILSAVTFYGKGVTTNSVADLSFQLEPLMGNWSKLFLGAGFFAAGLSSSITAPLAAAYAANGIFNWKGMKDYRFKIVWMFILFTGLVFSCLGWKPITVILFAQVANGILLPFIALFLLLVVNNKRILKNHVNSRLTNLIGVIVVLIAFVLGIKSVGGVFGLW